MNSISRMCRETLLVPAAVAGLAVGWAARAAWARRVLETARRDPVTGLPGRAAWTGQARRILRSRRTCTVLLVDLDKFKAVNDSWGHDAGDALLAVMAARLLSWTLAAGGGACGRLGGDELVAITRRPVADGQVAALARQLAAPASLPGAGSVPVSASVGAAQCRAREGLPAALTAADAAMYAAKRAGGALYSIAEAPVPGAPARSHVRARHDDRAAPVPVSPVHGQPSPGRNPA